MATEQDQILDGLTQGEYKFGFYTDIETDVIPKGSERGCYPPDFGKETGT
jgi:hypothetical protein